MPYSCGHPSIKICLPTREGPMLIYKIHRRDAYYVLRGSTEAPESLFQSEEARQISNNLFVEHY